METSPRARTAKRPSFSTVVADKLKEMIRREKLKPGDRIPTEAELCQLYGVSRTVVREAIVGLRSEGVLIARQGIGVFVAEASGSRFEVDWSAIQSLPKTIMVMELRLAIEVEAAGLCALRRTKADAVDIRRRMEKIDAERQDLRTANILYDYQFHLAIAKASKNPHIHQLLKYMAPVVMPRVKLAAIVDDDSKDAYYRMIHAEHAAIVTAIENKDEAAARAHMRAHISAAIDRLRKLAATLPKTEAKEAYETDLDVVSSLVRDLSDD
ncbi:MAG: FadR/GntR family transcriptional regulator [Hyphomicrobiaceae bacterium]